MTSPAGPVAIHVRARAASALDAPPVMLESRCRRLILHGPSGSGKTMLARALVAGRDDPLLPVFAGDVRLGAATYALGDLPDILNIGYVPEQSQRCFITGQVGDEIDISGMYGGGPLFDWASQSPLRQLRDRAITTLSGGQRRMLAIEATVLSRPQAIVIDAGLDALDSCNIAYVGQLLENYLAADECAVALVFCRDEKILQAWAGFDRQPLPDLGLQSWTAQARAWIDAPARPQPGAGSGAELAYLDTTGGYKSAGRWTIRQLSHRFQAGETLGIVGPNGSGKTTLLKLLSGYMPLASGDIELAGESLRRGRWPGVRGGLAYFSQEGSAIHEINHSVRPPDTYTPPAPIPGGELSAGEALFRAIEHALPLAPVVWIFDEPTGHLDAGLFEQVLRRIRHASPASLMLLVSHDLKLLGRTCDAIMEISQRAQKTALIPVDKQTGS